MENQKMVTRPLGPDVEYNQAMQPRPYSEAVRVGDNLYISGQIGVGKQGHLVSGGIQEETKQVLENIQNILARNSSSLDHIFKCTVILADIAEWAKMNEVYVSFFDKKRLPARTAFGGTLSGGARIEIECIARVDE